jgi:hypothetical protein
MKKDQLKTFKLQESVFWNVFRPPSNRGEQYLDQVAQTLKKKRVHPDDALDSFDNNLLLGHLNKLISSLKNAEERAIIKVSEAASGLITHCIMHQGNDPLVNISSFDNPWILDDDSAWHFNRRLTKQDLAQWKQSMAMLLADHIGSKLFSEFLHKEFSEENLIFMLECEELALCPTIEDFSRMAGTIYRKFIENDAPFQININSSTKKKLDNLFMGGSRVTFDASHRNCFDEAHHHIRTLLETDSYPRFCQTLNDSLLSVIYK